MISDDDAGALERLFAGHTTTSSYNEAVTFLKQWNEGKDEPGGSSVRVPRVPTPPIIPGAMALAIPEEVS